MDSGRFCSYRKKISLVLGFKLLGKRAEARPSRSKRWISSLLVCSQLLLVSQPSWSGQPPVKQQGRNSVLNCPNYLIDLQSKDDSSVWFADKPNENCHAPQGLRKLADPEVLERYFSETPGISVGIKPGFVTSGACGGATRFTKSQRRTLVSEYYYLINRLRLATFTVIDSVVSINQLIGPAPSWTYSSCVLGMIPETKQYCSALLSCPSKSDVLEKMVSRTSIALQAIIHLQNLIGNPVDDKGTPVFDSNHHQRILPRAEEESYKARGADYTARIKQIESDFPWIRGNQFGSYFRNKLCIGDDAGTLRDQCRIRSYQNLQFIREAIVAQLVQNRKDLLDQYQKIADAMICLNSSNKSRCAGIEETLAQTPEYVGFEPNPTLSAEERLSALEASSALFHPTCLRDTREARTKGEEWWKELGVNIVVGGLTLGLSAVAAAAKTGLTAVKTEMALATEAGNLAKAEQFALKAQKAARSLKTAELLMFGPDILNLGLSVKTAAEECAKATSITNKSIEELYLASLDKPKAACTADFVDAPTVFEAKDCMLAYMTNVLPAALMLMPAFIMRFRIHGEKTPSVHIKETPHLKTPEIHEVAAPKAPTSNRLRTLFKEIEAGLPINGRSVPLQELESVSESNFSQLTSHNSKETQTLVGEARAGRAAAGADVEKVIAHSTKAHGSSIHAAQDAETLEARFLKMAEHEDELGRLGHPNYSSARAAKFRGLAKKAGTEATNMRRAAQREVEDRLSWLQAQSKQIEKETAAATSEVKAASDEVRMRRNEALPETVKDRNRVAEKSRENGVVLAKEEDRLTRLKQIQEAQVHALSPQSTAQNELKAAQKALGKTEKTLADVKGLHESTRFQAKTSELGVVTGSIKEEEKTLKVLNSEIEQLEKEFVNKETTAMRASEIQKKLGGENNIEGLIEKRAKLQRSLSAQYREAEKKQTGLFAQGRAKGSREKANELNAASKRDDLKLIDVRAASPSDPNSFLFNRERYLTAYNKYMEWFRGFRGQGEADIKFPENITFEDETDFMAFADAMQDSHGHNGVRWREVMENDLGKIRKKLERAMKDLDFNHLDPTQIHDFWESYYMATHPTLKRLPKFLENRIPQNWRKVVERRFAVELMKHDFNTFLEKQGWIPKEDLSKLGQFRSQAAKAISRVGKVTWELFDSFIKGALPEMKFSKLLKFTEEQIMAGKMSFDEGLAMVLNDEKQGVGKLFGRDKVHFIENAYKLARTATELKMLAGVGSAFVEILPYIKRGNLFDALAKADQPFKVSENYNRKDYLEDQVRALITTYEGNVPSVDQQEIKFWLEDLALKADQLDAQALRDHPEVKALEGSSKIEPREVFLELMKK